MTTIVNLTQHVINVRRKDGETVSFTPSGMVARVAATATEVGSVEGIALRKTVFGAVENLPEPEADTILIVSALVRGAVPERTDVVSPGVLLRGEDGQPTGCDGFAC